MSRRTSPFPPYLAFLCEHMRYSFMIRVPKRRRTGNSSIIVHRYTSLAIIHLGLRNTPQERLWKMGRLSPLRETRMEHPTHVRQPGRRQISIWNTIPGTHNLGLGPNSLEASTLRPNRDNCEFRRNSAKTYCGVVFDAATYRAVCGNCSEANRTYKVSEFHAFPGQDYPILSSLSIAWLTSRRYHDL